MNSPVGATGSAGGVIGRSSLHDGISMLRAPRDAGPSDPDQVFADAQALAHVGSWEVEVATERVWWSDELCRIFGEPTGFTPTWAESLSRVHPEDRPAVREVLDRALGGTRSATAYRILRPDGEIRHVHGHRFIRVNELGEVTQLFGTLHDITEQRHAQLAFQEASELFETAFAQAPIGMALVGLDGRWLKVNDAVCRITGRSKSELLACSYRDVTHPDDLDTDAEDVRRLLAGEISGYRLEKRYLTKAGHEIWVLLSVSLARDAQGRPRHFISQIEDISERRDALVRLRRAEEAARTERDHARAIISAMHEGYALTVAGEIKAVNESLCRLTGFSESQLVGATTPFPFWPPEHLEEIMHVVDQVREHAGGTYEITMRRRNGERFEAEITAEPAFDASGQQLGFVNTMRDVSVQRRQQRELERLARTDSLTGLANRHVLQEALDRAAALAARRGTGLALILLDVDSFKQVNDRHGHPTGDAVLIEVARRLTSTVRPGDVLARVGGEEFAWLLADTRASETVVAADRARRAVSALPFETTGRLTVSAGVGLMRAPGDGDALYRLADRALYDAKQSGRNRTCCLTSD